MKNNPFLPPIDEITEKTLIQNEEVTDKVEIREISHQKANPAKSLTHDVITDKMKIKQVSSKEYKQHIKKLNHLKEDTSSEIFVKKSPVKAIKQSSQGFGQKLKLTLKMIMFKHTIFALPFALASALLALRGIPGPLDLIMIVFAMATARNAAMSFNRYIDAKIDKDNPRTKDREIPSGKLSKKFSLGFCITNAILFILISSYFNVLTLILSPFALTIILGYSLTKKFTHYTQIFLGLALGISPLAAWIALTGSMSIIPVCLGVAVMFWVSGFDIIYSTLDYDYDKKSELKNLVVKLGVKNALFTSKILHMFSFMFFILVGFLAHLSALYYFGCLVILSLLIYEHSLVKPDDLSKVNKAFFTLNGYIAISYFVFTSLDLLIFS